MFIPSPFVLRVAEPEPSSPACGGLVQLLGRGGRSEFRAGACGGLSGVEGTVPNGSERFLRLLGLVSEAKSLA